MIRIRFFHFKISGLHFISDWNYFHCSHLVEMDFEHFINWFCSNFWTYELVQIKKWNLLKTAIRRFLSHPSRKIIREAESATLFPKILVCANTMHSTDKIHRLYPNMTEKVLAGLYGLNQTEITDTDYAEIDNINIHKFYRETSANLIPGLRSGLKIYYDFQFYRKIFFKNVMYKNFQIFFSCPPPLRLFKISLRFPWWSPFCCKWRYTIDKKSQKVTLT